MLLATQAHSRLTALDGDVRELKGSGGAGAAGAVESEAKWQKPGWIKGASSQ